jgi:hypothetical protein
MSGRLLRLGPGFSVSTEPNEGCRYTLSAGTCSPEVGVEVRGGTFFCLFLFFVNCDFRKKWSEWNGSFRV